MRAAVLHEKNTPLVVEDVDVEAPRQGEVLVRIAASGVCRSGKPFIDASVSSMPSRFSVPENATSTPTSV